MKECRVRILVLEEHCLQDSGWGPGEGIFEEVGTFDVSGRNDPPSKWVKAVLDALDRGLAVQIWPEDKESL